MPPDAGATDRVDAATWRIAGTVTLGGIMTNIDTTVVNVAIESLARDFHASVPTVQWVATGYLLALAIVIPLSGWASDRFGAERVWMVSIGLFLAGSMLAGAAWSIGSLIFFRVLQGLGGGMIMPVGMALLTRAAGPSNWAMPRIPSARPTRPGPADRTSIAMPTGMIMPPPRPWRMRKAIRLSSDHETPDSTDPVRKTLRDVIQTRLPPKRSDAQPESGIATASARR